MKAIATHITNELISKITAAKDQYTPKDLLKAGFPQPLVEHVRITLDRLIYKELKMPTLDWLNTDNDLVREAWNDFVSIARSHSWLPNDYLYQFLNQSVEEILLIYLQPRANLADFLFEEDEELSYDEMSMRTQRLTVYKYFASAIPMYMKKRNLDTITRDRCKALITNLDSKLTDSYDPPEWLQKLELVFKFFNNRVDSRLFGLFFKDKEMNDLAEVFFREERPIDRNTFIDILESPENYGKKKPSKNKKKKNLAAETPVINKKEEQKIDEEEQKLIDSFFGGYRDDTIGKTKGLNNTDKTKQKDKKESSSIADQFKDIVSESEVDELVDSISMLKEEKKEKESGKSLNSWFFDDKEEDKTTENNITPGKSGKKEPEVTKSSISTLMEEAVTSWSSLSDEEEHDNVKKNKDADNDEKDFDDEVVFIAEDDSYDSNDPESEKNNNNDVPSLEGLIRPDLLDLIQGDKKRVSREKEPEEELDKEVECESELETVLEEEKEHIIDQIFLGAEHAYQEAIRDLQEFNDWASATDYITKKIFERNDVEMDTDIAVKFINQLQSYFNEK